MNFADWRRAGSGVLWASAAALAGLIVVQLTRIGAPTLVMADLVAQSGDFALLTFSGGNDDVLLVLDQRTESLLMYGVRGQNALEFKGRQDLRELFFDARRVSGGQGGK